MKRQTIKSRLKNLGLYLVITLHSVTLAAPFAVRAYAQEIPPAEVTVPAPITSPANDPTPPPFTPGPQQPTGVDSHMFAYNGDTNLWENAYFTWDSVTKQRSAKHQPVHTLNNETGLWEVREWEYFVPRGEYQFRITRTYAPALPDPAPASPLPDTPAPQPSPATPSPQDESLPASIQALQPLAAGNLYGASDISVIHYDNTSDTSFDLDIDANITNGVNLNSVSGDASVLQNVSGGSALSGNSTSMASILNMLQSTWGLNGMAAPELYVADIQGNYRGDILIDPSRLAGAASTCNCGGDLEVNASINGSITNNVDLLAASGNAAVSQNVEGGDATSGDATALANIVNLINSSIVSGQSFIGVLNIHGNLEGDILVAGDVIDELLAANVPTVDLRCNCAGDLSADFTDNQAIRNNITAQATSGTAGVNGNVEGGNAASGSAETTITVFNVTGRSIVGQDAMLVFVNVMGEWIGFLTNAPTGSTAAMYGEGISQNNGLGYGTDSDAEYDVDSNAVIENNVNVVASTGDASVNGNVRAGNATSGDAKAGANISNITNSTFSLTGWFGLLFINVLGDWYGSFGTDTAYGNLPAMPGAGSAGVSGPTALSTGGAGGRAGTAARRPSAAPDNVRVYSANIESDADGNAVLANISETTPPSSPAGVLASRGISLHNTIIGWLLVASGAATIMFFYRRKPGGSLFAS